MRRFAHIRLAAFQTRNKACWTSGPDFRGRVYCGRDCPTYAWLRSHMVYVRLYPVDALKASGSLLYFLTVVAWR